MSNRKVSVAALGHATSLFLVITFTLCVAFDYFFPEYAMYESWRRLLPGFDGLNLKSFIIGFVESYGYGWYFALVWAPLYNFFATRR